MDPAVTELVPAEDIERIVGVKRHEKYHYARAVSAEQTVYVLHPHECIAMYTDLRVCPWSIALDDGIDTNEWVEDTPLRVNLLHNRLKPLRPRKEDKP